MAEDLGYYSETQNKYIEAPKKQLFRMQIPYSLRFGLIWTLFFVIIGIVIQSIKAGYFVFGLFFVYQIMLWIKTRNLGLCFITGLFFAALFVGGTLVKTISWPLIIVFLILELGAILYMLVWK
jgi:hypothetical protein